ncbi:MAG TPA: ABC transporter ATP-binding protein [Treponemataceae bacterium]|nr:ABC transporter ATP-binding protein [Treponemataceae bacterium]
MQKYLTIVNISKGWDTFSVQFSCELDKGTMLGIVGQSGSGKSTVLRLISGLLSFSKTSTLESKKESKIMLGGRDISKLPPAKRGVGMVFQNHALFAHMRVDDNVAYGLRSSKKISKKESRIQAEHMLEKFGMRDFSKRYPDSLSGGEAQRVSLARTLIVKPDLILFDEPFASLDAPLRKKLALDIKRLQAETGFTGIMVTHDIAEAKQMSDVITIMKQGKQIWTGEPGEFRENMM